MKAGGITRSPRFSPNMQNNDLAIMRLVKKQLELQGIDVSLIDEDEWAENDAKIDPQMTVFTMMRSNKALEKLELYEKNGCKTINSSTGIRNAERKKIIQIMAKIGTDMPQTQILAQNDNLNIDCPCWIKKGEGWAQTNTDVQLAKDETQARLLIQKLREKYPNGSVVATRHINGDIVKFYGVQGTDFFFWKYPDITNTKFGAEIENGIQKGFIFNQNKLKNICDYIALNSQILIYGGDCIIDNNGKFYIIDFNDWPSFSPCQLQAAQAIAEKIINITTPTKK